MENTPSPAGFEIHRQWVDKLVNEITTPCKPRRRPVLAELTSTSEHVLRGSKSWAARSWKSRASGNSLRVPSNKENRSTNASEADLHVTIQLPPNAAPVLGEIAPNNQALRSAGPWRPRRSPTPSLRKKKIESLVKAHGSPQHVRVTAGGRIVPSDQSPLCHPRYGYSAVNANGGLVKFAPNHPMGSAQWTQATQNGFVAQDVNGRLCQIVDGTVLPLTEIEGALQLFMPAPNLNITRRGPSLSAIPAPVVPTGNPQHHHGSRTAPAEPPVSAQINALELEYAKREFELRDVDKTEVLHGRTMGKTARDALIGKRRELVMTLDNIRRALKSLKDQVPTDAQISPHAAQHRQSISPSKTRLPAFLQQRRPNQSMAMPPVPQALYGPFYAAASQPPPFAPPYGFQAAPSPDSAVPGLAGNSWSMPPASMFMPPPPFDGSISTSPPVPAEPFTAPVPFQQAPQPQPFAAVRAPPAELRPPQNDGASSSAALQKVASPHKSHALPIKVPESKILKSNLNPMSPVYKPGTGLLKDTTQIAKPIAKSVKGPALTPLSPAHQLLPPSTGRPLRVVNTTDETLSPNKKSALVHSSSIASFDTADFFPRNTREYSTRQHAYTPGSDQSEDKENIDFERRDSKLEETPVTPAKERTITHGHPVLARSGASRVASPPSKGPKPPAAPPCTPVDADAVAVQHSLPLSSDGTTWERQNRECDTVVVPDREAHNLSPKAKRRDWLFVEEHPLADSETASSSPAKYQHACQDELCVTSSPYDDAVDSMKKPRDFVEGYQSGLQRKPPGFDSSADFLEGYCAALMKAKVPSVSVELSTGSPVKSTSRRLSPMSVTVQAAGVLQTDYRTVRPTLEPFENNVKSMDTLKQAVFAQSNENAILTPAADGPHANEPPFNLGAWAKTHESVAQPVQDPTAMANALAGFQFPKRTSSVINKHVNVSDDRIGPRGETTPIIRGSEASQASIIPLQQSQNSGHAAGQPLASPTLSGKSIPSSSNASMSQRISSMTSIDSNLYRNYPGSRVFSPHLEWKSASSVAQHAGLANGAFFAHAQFDGVSESAGFLPATQLTPNAGAPQSQRPMSATTTGDFGNPAMQQHGRFREGSLDGMSNPPTSPGPPMSPPMSPKVSPSKEKARESPNKGSSPARTTIEHLAGRVGIKATNPKEKESEAGSPQGKRRGWANVWRGSSSRKETSKEDHV
ncbi:hypothetical protein LTR08_009110 [Meristemomyces frigidus]|nr:hypothetical protein LTR08_009110 [Meristemomyces frigidus]